MRLDSVISQAAGGLDSISRQLAVVSQNVSNANTPGYVRETLRTSSVAADGQGMGVRSGVATRSLDAALQTDLFVAGGRVAYGQARQDTLTAIDAASGAPGSGQDLPGLLGSLRDAFSTLQADPANVTQQHAVVTKAALLAQGVNGLGAAVSAARQTAQDGVRDDLVKANDALRSLGELTDQVIAAEARGLSTADLEDKRDAAIQTVTELTGAQVLRQANGDVLAVSGGTVLSLRSATGPLSLDDAALAPGSTAPSLLVAGQVAPLGGGRIGAELELRDTTLPGIQAKLDGFAQALAGGFAASGLDLFTDASGTVPATPGFAQSIQVNPAVQAAPAMVRDGSAAAGAAGSTTLIDAVLGGVLAGGTGTVTSQASQVVADNAGLAAAASRQVTTEQAVQSSLSTKLSAQTGVSIDSELAQMVKLQNSYGANARVISTVQSLWTELLNAVR